MVQAEHERKEAKRLEAEARKAARATAKAGKTCAALASGASTWTRLQSAADVRSLNVAQLRSVLSFRAVTIPPGAKKSELIELAESAFIDNLEPASNIDIARLVALTAGDAAANGSSSSSESEAEGSD